MGDMMAKAIRSTTVPEVENILKMGAYLSYSFKKTLDLSFRQGGWETPDRHQCHHGSGLLPTLTRVDRCLR